MLHATIAKASVSECKMVWRIRNHTCTEVINYKSSKAPNSFVL